MDCPTCNDTGVKPGEITAGIGDIIYGRACPCPLGRLIRAIYGDGVIEYNPNGFEEQQGDT